MHPRRLEYRILRSFSQANRDFGLVTEGDRILVAMSGGKDSYALMWALMKLKASAEYSFDLVGYHLDQGQPGHDVSPIKGHLEQLGVPFEIEYQDTYTRVVEMTEAGKVYCALCSRFRRAIVYAAANRLGCNKVALGHHRDDMIETLLLNLFHSGQLKSMPPKLRSDDGKQMVIRPLTYVPETELVELAEQQRFPIMPCRLCGSQDSERKAVKELLEQLSARYPRMRQSMLAAMGNVRKTHLLDPKLNPLYAREPLNEADFAAMPVDDESDDVCATRPAPEAEGAMELVQLGGLLGSRL